MKQYVECVDIGFLENVLGRHEWTTEGMYGQLTLGIDQVRNLDWDMINFVMVF